MVKVLDKTKASSRLSPLNDESMFEIISSAPVTFVTGKGGVGKTTIASLLSKAAAKHGERILFVSLHNDLTSQKLLGIDSEVKANEIINTKIDNVDFVLSTPAATLGTYLSNNKLGAFTSKLINEGLLESIASTIPSMRELLIVSDIRTKFESQNWDRIIVDTPSTGHASSIFTIGETVTKTAQSGIIRDQANTAEEFLSSKNTQLVIVTLDHVMPLSECKDFIYFIEDETNVTINSVIVNRTTAIANNGSKNIDQELDQIFLLLYALEPTHKKQPKKTFWPFKKDKVPSLLSASLKIDSETKTCIVLGTGGVGKTTTSAALAIANAKQKRKVALLTIDPAKRLGTALGLENSKSRESYVDPFSLEAVSDKRNSLLHVYQLDARTEFMEMLERTLSRKEYRKAKKNTFVQGVSRAGIINEFMAIEQIHKLTTSGQYDLVVVDTPPTQHIFDLIDTPSTLQKVFASPIFKALVNASSIAGLGANITLKTFFRPLRILVGTLLINDTIAFLKTIRDVEQIFSEHVDEVSVILRSSTTKYIGVTRPDEISSQQIMKVANEMRLKDYKFSTIILNGCDIDEYDVDGDLIPFAQHALSKDIATRTIPTFEYNQPEKIVKEMAKELI